jgi:hypothetical protein
MRAIGIDAAGMAHGRMVGQNWLAVAFKELVSEMQKQLKGTPRSPPNHERTLIRLREVAQVQFVVGTMSHHLRFRFIQHRDNVHQVDQPGKGRSPPEEALRG